MSTNNDNPEEVKKEKEKKKYMFFGYGAYPSTGDPSGFNTVNIRADAGIFDKLFEIFGVKEKPKKETGEEKTD